MTKTSKIILWVIGAVIIIGGIYYATRPAAPAEPTDTIPSGIACTMDAKLCPDGTYVGRTGPKCEFVCPTGATTSKNMINGVPVVDGNVDANGTVVSFPADIGK